MFFASDSVLVDLIGVFKIERDAFFTRTATDRNYDSLSVRIKGSGTIFAEGREYDLKEGNFIYLPQNQKYNQRTDGETIIAIHFIRYSSEKKPEAELIVPEKPAEVLEITKSMYKLWTEKKPGYKQGCTALLYKLLYMFRGQTEKGNALALSVDKILDKAIDYIHKNYRRERILISGLAEAASVSEAYFRRCFRSVYGVSPARYIINLKLEYAAGLLQSGFYTVSETAEKAGFSDIKYFQRLFKQSYGHTPAQYKRLNLERTFK